MANFVFANYPSIMFNSRKWLSAKKRRWTHVTLDLALTYDSDLSEPSDGCRAVTVENKQLKARPCSEKYSALCMNQDLGKVLLFL